MKNTVMIDSSFYTSANKSLRSMAKSLESYQKDFDLLMSNRNELLKMYSSYSQIQISEMAESLRKTMDLYAKINASYLTNDLFSDSMRNTIESLAQSFKAYEQMNIAESAKAIAESINAMSKSLRLEQLKQLQQIDFSCMFADIVPKSTSLSDIVETAYSRVQEVLTEQATDSKGFQAKFANWTEKKKIQFFIIWQLICFIYGNFFQPYFQENVGIPVTAYVVSNVKELPEKGARIIGKIHENIEAIITENTNYYYRVTFTNENGEIIEGYVAKRNLKIIEEKKDAIDEIHSESE